MRFAAILALAAAFALSACVGSEAPLLPEAESVGDGALAGVWLYRDGDKRVMYNVSAQGRAYTIASQAQPQEKPLIATLHRFDSKYSILQMRKSGAQATPYVYTLMLTPDGRPDQALRLKADICDREIARQVGLATIKTDFGGCTITTRAQLTTLMTRAAKVFEQDSAKLVTITRAAR